MIVRGNKFISIVYICVLISFNGEEIGIKLNLYSYHNTLLLQLSDTCKSLRKQVYTLNISQKYSVTQTLNKYERRKP